MRWEGGRASSNVEDRRGRGVARGGGMAVGCGSIVVALIYVGLGGDPRDAVRLVEAGQQLSQGSSQGAVTPAPGEDKLADFISVVLASTEDAWSDVFAADNKRYQPPKLVLFRGAVDSACGHTSAAVGPFYCPGDRKAYVDLSFYEDLQRRFGAPGDFAQAYVIAHEIGHHVQNLLGTSTKVHQAERAAKTEAEANAWSVKLELQADCYAGVWAHHAERTRRWLEPGDVEEALKAAAAIGDDAIQKKAKGFTVPETWTHGSSEQRAKWLRIGMTEGRLAACDTFATR